MIPAAQLLDLHQPGDLRRRDVPCPRRPYPRPARLPSGCHLLLRPSGWGAVQTNYLIVTTAGDATDASPACSSIGTSTPCSLRDAVTAANTSPYTSGADIGFASSVTGTITLGGALPAITGMLDLVASGTGNLTVSGGGAVGPIFSVNSGANVALSGLTISNGNNAGNGGGIANSGSLELSNIRVSNSTSNSVGGGIFSNGTLLVNDSTLSGNTAEVVGGGIYNYDLLIVNNTTLSANQTLNNNGGGIFNLSVGAAVVSNSTFSGNTAPVYGGGIANNGTLTLTDSTFLGNSAANGGALASGITPLTATNNLLAGDLGGECFDSGAGCPINGSNGNVVGVAANLSLLGNYGGPTQTVLPLPGSVAICAGVVAGAAGTTDQRGYARLNTTYLAGTPCVDAGAVQTNYQSVQFALDSYSGVTNQVLSPAPIVSVTENGQNIGGVPITLGVVLGTPADLSGLGPVTTVAGTGATFDLLEATVANTYSVSATLDVIPNTYAVSSLVDLNISLPATVTALTDSVAGSSVYGQSVTFTATVTSSSTPVTSGTVTFTDTTTGATLASGVALNGSGQASVTLSTLAVGGHTIEAAYNGTTNYQASSNTDSFTVNKANTSTGVTSSLNPSIYGQSATFTATVSPLGPGAGTPTGTVTFLDGGSTIGSGTLSGGVATLTISSLLAGNHTITTTYTGDGSFNGSAGSLTGNPQVVNKATPAFSLAPSANPTLVFSSLTFTATASSAASTPTGSITFYDGSTQLGLITTVGGAATYTSATLAVGTHPISAVYSGDSNFLSVTSSTVSELINPITPTLSWSPAPGFTYGNTLSSILNASALTGGVAVPGIYVYKATPSGGSSSTVTASTLLVVGSYTLTVNFTPTDITDYNSLSASVPFTVTRATPTVSVVSSQNPALLTNQVTLTATVSAAAGTPTGTITFVDGSTPLASAQTLVAGVTTYKSSSFALGTHSITAIYSGDANFNGVTSGVLAQTMEDFTLNVSSTSGASITALPGGTATYAFQVNPTSGTAFPSAVVFGISGLPAGATATITPKRSPRALPQPPSRWSFSWPTRLRLIFPSTAWVGGWHWRWWEGWFCCPSEAGRGGWPEERAVSRVLMLLLGAATLAALGLTACGGGGGTGYFGQQVQNYTVTITGTSGGLSHSTTVNLTVQ